MARETRCCVAHNRPVRLTLFPSFGESAPSPKETLCLTACFGRLSKVSVGDYPTKYSRAGVGHYL